MADLFIGAMLTKSSTLTIAFGICDFYDNVFKWNISCLLCFLQTYYKNVSYPSKNKSNLVDSIILAAMELDVINVINLAW